jgi:hypothetical protein
MPHDGRQLSWYFDDSSHRDGLTRGLDGEHRWVGFGLGSGDTTLTDGAVLTDQFGTPRGRCDEHSSTFSLSYETKV